MRVICWLTGYDISGLQAQIEKEADIKTLFSEAPQINSDAHKITGVICGVHVEDIEDPLMQKIRWLDKLVDELAKGKSMEKVYTWCHYETSKRKSAEDIAAKRYCE